MEATKNCTIAIGTSQDAGKKAKSVIEAVYESYVSYLVVMWYLLRPHVQHVCVLLPLVIPHIRHAHLGLHIAVSLKDRTTHIWPFDCGFTCATKIEFSGLKLPFGIVILFKLLTIIK